MVEQKDWSSPSLIKTTELHNPDIPPNAVNNRYIFTNVSGLRVNHSGDTLTPEFLGMSSDETTGETSGPEFGTLTSGGLSVNVGNFLEIKPGDIPVDCNEFYDGGKVNVRIGNGLGDDGNNRIAVKLTGNAAAFDSDGNVNVNVAFLISSLFEWLLFTVPSSVTTTTLFTMFSTLSE